jgi:hypothetical protein
VGIKLSQRPRQAELTLDRRQKERTGGGEKEGEAGKRKAEWKTHQALGLHNRLIKLGILELQVAPYLINKPGGPYN